MRWRIVAVILVVLTCLAGGVFALRRDSTHSAKPIVLAPPTASGSPYGSCADYPDAESAAKAAREEAAKSATPSLHILALVRTDAGAAEGVEVRLFKESPAPSANETPLKVVHTDDQGRFRFDVSEDVLYLAVCKLDGYTELRVPIRAGKPAELLLKR